MQGKCQQAENRIKWKGVTAIKAKNAKQLLWRFDHFNKVYFLLT